MQWSPCTPLSHCKESRPQALQLQSLLAPQAELSVSSGEHQVMVHRQLILSFSERRLLV